MTSFVLIGCTAIVVAAMLVGVTLAVQAWERVQLRRTDNWVIVNRENVAANRSTIRDALRSQGDQQ